LTVQASGFAAEQRVQTAEATARFVFERVRRELFRLLPAEKQLGLSLTSAGQLVPEHSTAAIILHHPEAHYFRA
jgi:Vitamin B12 dependent methionine synthase, activation domain